MLELNELTQRKRLIIDLVLVSFMATELPDKN